MKIGLKIYITIYIILVFPTILFSQAVRAIIDSFAAQIQVPASFIQRTSVYLSPSKACYVRGEDLWFQAFVLDSKNLSLSAQDKTIYLQLQKAGSENAVWQEMYPITNGQASGHVYLADTLAEGNYLLKAYTAHSFYAHQNYFYPVASIRIAKNPHSLVHGYYGRKSDTLARKKPVRLTFFAEGVNFVAGLPCRLAFHALDTDGKPVKVNGTQMKDKVPLLSIKTMHDGMGSFLFTPARNTNYQVKLDHIDSLYALPQIQESGIIMQLVKNGDDSLVFRIRANYPKQRRVFLRLQTRGNVQAMATGILRDSLVMKLPVANSMQGISEASVLDEKGQVISTRLVYLHQDRQLKITFSGLKERYGQKEKVTLRIKTTDNEGRPVATLLTLRVHDGLFGNPANGRDIVNYYNLSTQIQGIVDDPSYYFDTSHPDRKEALDVLLLCNGTGYTWNTERVISDIVNDSMVLNDSLPAQLTPTKAQKKRYMQPLSLMFSNYTQKNTQLATTDSMGNFYITSGNLSMGSRFFVRYFSQKEYSFRLPNPFDWIRTSEKKDHPIYILAEKNITMNDTNSVVDTAGLSQYSNLLESVIVKTRGRGFSDRYLGYLDSIARYEGNTDYVGECGWLNCPDGRTNIKPVEGKTYPMFTDKNIISHSTGVRLTKDNWTRIAYHYPKYTEEELLRKFNMAIIKGYYQGHKFQEPD